MQSASEQVIPAGMKPWSGGDSAPEDYVRGKVMFRNGALSSFEEGPWNWRDDGELSDIIAYTPSPAPMVEQAGEVIQADRVIPEKEDRLRSGIVSEVMAYAGLNSRDSNELADQILTRVAALNTRPAPAETEGKTIYVWWADDGVHIRKWDHKPFEHGEPITAIASTPPADAGMLDDIEEIEMGLSLGLNEASRAPAGFRISILARTIQQARKGLAALQTKEAAALNSQAHQIRETMS